MTKTIIVYGSTTGNTLQLAEEIEENIKRYNGDVELAEVTDLHPSDLTAYELILLGCSTWGDGELQDDFITFEEEMKEIDLKGRLAACFGPGDSDYPLFCEAVDILENRLGSCGARIVLEGLKIDGDVESQFDIAGKWVNNLLKSVNDLS